MKTVLVLAIAMTLGSEAHAQYGTRNNGMYGGSYNSGGYGTGSNPNSHYVQPHYNFGSGSFTSGHQRTNPNNTQYDNFSTRGNYNPYTGAYGTRSPRY